MRRTFAALLAFILLAGGSAGCQTQSGEAPEAEAAAVESADNSEIPVPEERSEEPLPEPADTPDEPSEADEETADFLTEAAQYLHLLDGTFADLYAQNPELKLYFSYNYGFYTSNAMLDYSMVIDDYGDVNTWFQTEGELTGPDPGMADSYYNFETGSYAMEDFPVTKVYLSASDLAELYADNLTKEDMEEILGVEIRTVVNEMSGLTNSLPIELDRHLVEIVFSDEGAVSSVGISLKE